MTLTFEEASTGVATKVKLPRQEKLRVLQRTGAKKGPASQRCATCGGRDSWHTKQGFFHDHADVPACQGAGQMIKERCPDCRGQGRIEREKTIELRIPPGVDTGTRLASVVKGEPGRMRPAGDLFVVLEVKEHSFFERRGATCMARFRSALRRRRLERSCKFRAWSTKRS